MYIIPDFDFGLIEQQFYIKKLGQATSYVNLEVKWLQKETKKFEITNVELLWRHFFNKNKIKNKSLRDAWMVYLEKKGLKGHIFDMTSKFFIVNR